MKSRDSEYHPQLMSDQDQPRSRASFLSAASARRLAVPIRYALPGAFALLIILAVGAVMLLSYLASERSASSMALDMSELAAEQIQQSVDRFLETPQQLLQVDLAAYHAGDMDLTDFARLTHLFWYQAHISSSVRYVYYGAADGTFVGSGTTMDQVPILEIRDAQTAPSRLSYRLDTNGQRVGTPSREEYDPRTRPWYRSAVEADGPTWSPIYTALGLRTGQLQITAVEPVRDGSGRLQGVLASDVSLSDLTSFLRSIKPSDHGGTFIIERNGLLVATSSQENPAGDGGVQANTAVSLSSSSSSAGSGNGNASGQDRLSAESSHDPLIRGTAAYIASKFGGFDRVPDETNPATGQQEPMPVDFELSGKHEYAQVFTITNGRGLDWLLVVVVPAEDFMGGWSSELLRALAIGVVVLGAAVTLGYVIARWIVVPVTTMGRVARGIEKDQYDLGPLDAIAKRPDELGNLAKVLKRMAAEVRSRELTLRNQVEKLRVEIDEVKRNAEVQAVTDTDAFRNLLDRARRMRQERGTAQQRSATQPSPGPGTQPLDPAPESAPEVGDT